MTKEAPRQTGQNPSSEGKKYSILNDQQYWQKIFQNGEYNLYDRNRKPVQWDAFRDASYEWVTDPAKFIKNFGTHIHNIDTDFRGGKDAGGAKERLERVGAMLGVIAAFTAFDYVTSKPFEGKFPVDKTDIKLLPPDVLRSNATNGAIMKFIDVLNDKYATALGNMLAERLTGKRGFIHEVADKGADTIQEGFSGSKDLMNGATLESYIRILSQVPIAGALFEQGVTRLALLQERSSLHTATGKMVYMALGVFTKFRRAAAGKESPVDAGDLLAAAAR